MNLLITGISKGLGLKISEIAIDKGHKVFGISRNKTEDLEDLISKANGDLSWKSIDLADKGFDVKKDLFDDFIGKNEIHGFINNAALAYDDIVTNLDEDRLAKMFKVNAFSPMMITKYVIRNMLLHKVKGSIVHISSISVHTGYKGLAMYASTKGALEAFSKNTAREWGEMGVRSNCIVAGFMETEMSSELSTDQKNRIYKRTVLKKPTTLKSVSETVLYLLSDRSESITGQNIFVDSGTI